MFNDNEIDKKVKYQLGIFDDTEPTEDDLNKVTEILISNINFRGEIINTDISELSRLRELRLLDLKGFELSEDILEIVNNFAKLVQLKLYSCNFKGPIRLDIKGLKSLIIDHCKSVDFSMACLPRNVLIIDSGVIDIEKMRKCKGLKELGIKKSEIINSNALIKMNGLETVNFDGSVLDKDTVLDCLLNKGISVSHKREFYRLN